MSSDGPARRSQQYTDHQQQSYRPTAPYAESQTASTSGSDFTNPTTSYNGFFSPQTAFYPPSSQQQSMPGMDTLANNPLLNVGLNIAGHGIQDFTSRTMNKLPTEMKKSLTSIKYYFAVDQSYVFKKLCLLLFPFRPRNWSLGYSADEPVPPRVDTNAPDYYIPLMSAITYVLVAGLVLGTQQRFTPEQLGMHASSVLVWNIIENSILFLIFYIFNIQSKLRTLDLIAYCGYKYVGMIAALTFYLLTHSIWIYRCALIYSSISISYFLMKCLRLQILPDVGGSQAYNSDRSQRRVYLLLLIVILQPIFIWYLTRHLIVT